MDRAVCAGIAVLVTVAALASVPIFGSIATEQVPDTEPWRNVYPLGGFEAELPPLEIAAAPSYGDGLRTGLVYRCPEAAYSGNYGLRLLTGGRESVAVELVTPVQTASAVRISFMVRTPAATPQDLQLLLGPARTSDDSQTLSRLPVPGAPFTVTANWTEISFTLPEPPAGRIALLLELGPNGHLMIDDLQFEQRLAAENDSIDPTSD